MFSLGIETATWMGGVALVDDKQGVLLEQSFNSRASHSERLLPAIERLFKETEKRFEECSCICVSIGPGSFTGLRIGLATTKGLAVALDKPIVGISTLEVLARGVPFINITICSIIEARKKELFASFYKWCGYELLSLEREMVIKPDDLIKKVHGETIFIGDGAAAYGDKLRKELGALAIFASHPFNFPRPSILAKEGLKRFLKNQVSSPDEIVPVYIRPSEAELNWK